MGVYVPCCNFTTKYHQFVSIEVRLFDVDVVSQGQGVRALLGHLEKLKRPIPNDVTKGALLVVTRSY